MTVSNVEAILNFIETELCLHRELQNKFIEDRDKSRELAARACIYELELLQAYIKHLPQVYGDE